MRWKQRAFLRHGLQPGPLCHGPGLLESARTAGGDPHRAGCGPRAPHDALRPGGPFRVARVSQRSGPLVLDSFGRQRSGRTIGPGGPLPATVDGRVAGGVGQRDRRAAVGPGSRALVPPRPGTAPDRIAPDRLRHGRAHRHARGPGRGHRTHVVAVAVLPRPRRAAAHGGQSDDFSLVAGDNAARKRRW